MTSTITYSYVETVVHSAQLHDLTRRGATVGFSKKFLLVFSRFSAARRGLLARHLASSCPCSAFTFKWFASHPWLGIVNPVRVANYCCIRSSGRRPRHRDTRASTVAGHHHRRTSSTSFNLLRSTLCSVRRMTVDKEIPFVLRNSNETSLDFSTYLGKQSSEKAPWIAKSFL